MVMSNFGWYQNLTSMANKVGGPKQLICLFLGCGILIGGGAVATGNTIKKKVTAKINKKNQAKKATIVYTVSTDGKSNEGLLFKVGDTFRVLETDGDAGLIEKLGDQNNPYFVSLKFLETISDYKNSAKGGQ